MTDAVAYEIPTAPNDPAITAGSPPRTGRTRPSSARLTQRHRLFQPPWTHLAVRREHGGGQGEVKGSGITVLASELPANRPIKAVLRGHFRCDLLGDVLREQGSRSI